MRIKIFVPSLLDNNQYYDITKKVVCWRNSLYLDEFSSLEELRSLANIINCNLLVLHCLGLVSTNFIEAFYKDKIEYEAISK